MRYASDPDKTIGYADKHRAMAFDTYEDSTVIAVEKRKSDGNVDCRRNTAITSWKYAVADISSERKEHVRN